MIFIFHSLYYLAQYAYKIYKQHTSLIEFHESNKKEIAQIIYKIHDETDLENVLYFDPPVYKQRYAAVQEVLLDERWRKDIKKIIEFGCAEMNFFQYLKHLYGVTEIYQVDFDEKLLEEKKFKCEPLNADFLKQRSDPLVVKLLCGNISDPDYRLINCDAVIGIEIIEHLYPDTLDLMPNNIFGYIKPKIAIFTTPNADFNVLFPRFKKFRHADHKFEWTRKQFKNWALNITQRFPQYSVTFDEIGCGPKGTESLGKCSQMAIFLKEYDEIHQEVPSAHNLELMKHTNLFISSFGVCTLYSYMNQIQAYENTKPKNCDKSDDVIKINNFYKVIATINYPYTCDSRTSEEKILHALMYNIYRQANVHSRFYNEDKLMVEIPLYDIITNFDGCFTSEIEARKLLEEKEFTIEECILYGCDNPCLCVIYDINMDQRSTTPISTDENNIDVEANETYYNNESEEDWDLESCKWREKDAPKCDTNNETSPLSNQLYDSGYQKSISNAEWSPQSPIDGVFEEHFNSCTKLDVNDIKDNIKANLRNKELLNQVKSLPLNNKTPIKNAAGSSTKKSPIREANPSPGTSDVKKRRKSRKSDSDDDSLKEEVKTIANCIIYNSLNKIDVDEEFPQIQPIILAPLIPMVIDPPFIVENGDLANNNRDLEGNNYDEAPIVEQFHQLDDNINENRDMHDDNVEPQRNNLNQDVQNRNDIPNNEENLDVGHAVMDDIINGVVEEEEEEVPGLNYASREALFDPNSQVDMLEEYAIPAVAEDQEGIIGPQVVFIGLRELDENGVALNVEDPFPNWLLQLLGQNTEDDENHDEPHFYCQGDGLGVHPSIIEVDVEESSSDTSSGNDDAEAETAISEYDVGSLPVDVADPSDLENLAIVGQSLQMHAVSSAVSANDSGDEFYDTLDSYVPDQSKNQ